MASNVDGADHWGCAAGGMESMEAGRTATLAFGLSLWGAGDGGRWTLGRLSAIASGNGGISHDPDVTEVVFL